MDNTNDGAGPDPVEQGAERIARDAATIRGSRERELEIDAQLAQLAQKKAQEGDIQHAAEKDIADVDAELQGRTGAGPVMPPQPPRPRVG